MELLSLSEEKLIVGMLSVNFFCGRLAPLFDRRYRAIPSIARPRCVGRGCGAGFVGAVMGPCFVYVSCSGRFDLFAIAGSACCGALQRASLW